MLILNHILASFFLSLSKFGVSERCQTDEQSSLLTVQTAAQMSSSPDPAACCYLMQTDDFQGEN